MFLITMFFVNKNISNITNKVDIPTIIVDFSNFLKEIFKLITLNKIEVDNIYILFYSLEIVLLCLLIYILSKFFNLKDKHQKQLKKIKGFKNADEEHSYVVKRQRNKENIKVLEEIYNANGMPLSEWKEKQENTETVTNRVIVDIKEVEGTKNKICVSSNSPKYKVPKVLDWKESFLSPINSILVLRENVMEQVIVDLNKTPGILLRWKYRKWKNNAIR